jgi:hypothetical protein
VSGLTEVDAHPFKDSAHVQTLVLNEHGLMSIEAYIILLPSERLHKRAPSVSFFGESEGLIRL